MTSPLPASSPFTSRSAWARRGCVAVVFAAAAAGASFAARADLPAQVAALKPSVVVVGYFKSTDNPRFTMSGTGFAVADGNLLVTNAHVLAVGATADLDAQLTVQLPAGPTGERLSKPARLLELDRVHDLALLRFDGPPLPPVRLRDAANVREGQAVAFIGFPLGGALGFSPVTHRGIVASIAAVALPSRTAQQLPERNIRQLRDGNFDVFQLDATTYPGNSGGPLFDADTGDVIGVVNMTFVKSTREASLASPSGISYAIPATYVLQLLQRQAGARKSAAAASAAVN